MFLDKIISVLKSVYIILIVGFLIAIICWTVRLTGNARRKHKERIQQEKQKRAFQKEAEELFNFQYHPKTTDFVTTPIFKCPSCGASVPSKTPSGNLSVFCIYCGGKLPEAEKYIDLQIQDYQKRVEYELYMSQKSQDMNREEKHELHKTLMDYFPVILFSTFVVIIFVLIIIKTSSIPR